MTESSTKVETWMRVYQKSYQIQWQLKSHVRKSRTQKTQNKSYMGTKKLVLETIASNFKLGLTRKII